MFDWASDHHDVVLVDQQGKVVEEFRFDDTAEPPYPLRRAGVRVESALRHMQPYISPPC
ncbi:MAG: hypothetical protein WBE26_11465 [Phycisphaerae bacterium]